MSEPKFNFIPSIDAGPEEIEKQKKIINNEGIEGNVGMQIGTEDEQRKLDFERENEGNYLDLASYISVKKQRICSIDDIPQDKRERCKKGNGFILYGNTLVDNEYSGHSLIYIDSNNDVSFVFIKTEGIKSLEGQSDEYRVKKIEEQLKELGFNISGGDSIVVPLVKQIEAYKKNKEERLNAEKKENFSF